MSDTGFQSRLSQLETVANLRARQTKPTFPKARNRKEKLAIALAHLEQGGITGAYAYAPLFQFCAKMGFIIKPLHYRSWAGLILFFMATTVCIAAFVLFAVAVTGTMPRPVRGLIEAGPKVFFSGAFVLSAFFASLHKLKALQIDLPNWRDI